MRRTVSTAALKDISAHNRLKILSGEYERINQLVGHIHLQTKETRRLNRLLGIAGINKIGNRNGVKPAESYTERQ